MPNEDFIPFAIAFTIITNGCAHELHFYTCIFLGDINIWSSGYTFPNSFAWFSIFFVCLCLLPSQAQRVVATTSPSLIRGFLNMFFVWRINFAERGFCTLTVYLSFISNIYQARAELQEVKVMGISNNLEYLSQFKISRYSVKRSISNNKLTFLYRKLFTNNNSWLTHLLDSHVEGDVGVTFFENMVLCYMGKI